MLSFLHTYYWYGVIVAAFIAVFALSCFFFVGGHGRMMRWCKEHTRYREGEDAAKFFSTLGVIVAPVPVAFLSFYGLPLYFAVVLAWYATRSARTQNAAADVLKGH